MSVRRFGNPSSPDAVAYDATAATTTHTDTAITGSTAAQPWATGGTGWSAAPIGTTEFAVTAG